MVYIDIVFDGPPNPEVPASSKWKTPEEGASISANACGGLIDAVRRGAAHGDGASEATARDASTAHRPIGAVPYGADGLVEKVAYRSGGKEGAALLQQGRRYKGQ